MELDGAQYLGFRLPFTITQLVWIEAILVGGAEVYRNREREPEKRLYPGKLSCSACGRFPSAVWTLRLQNAQPVGAPAELLGSWQPFPATVSACFEACRVLMARDVLRVPEP